MNAQTISHKGETYYLVTPVERLYLLQRSENLDRAESYILALEREGSIMDSLLGSKIAELYRLHDLVTAANKLSDERAVLASKWEAVARGLEEDNRAQKKAARRQLVTIGGSSLALGLILGLLAAP